SHLKSPPNPRLQRTRAAVPLQTVRGETSSLGGVRRAPLSRKPLGDFRAGGLAGFLRLAAPITLIALASCASRVPTEPRPDTGATVAVLARLAAEYNRLGTIFVCFSQADVPEAVLELVRDASGIQVKPCHARLIDSRGLTIDAASGARGVVVGI